MKKLLFCAILSLCVNASAWAQDYKIDLIDISSVAVDEASVKHIDGKIHMHIHNVDKALAGTMPNAIVADSIYSQAVKDNLGKLLSQIKTRMDGNDVEFVKLYMQCSENLQQQLQITHQGQDSVQVSDHQIVQCVVEYYLDDVADQANVADSFKSLLKKFFVNSTNPPSNYSADVILDCTTKTMVYERLTFSFDNGSTIVEEIAEPLREVIDGTNPQGALHKLFERYCNQ